MHCGTKHAVGDKFCGTCGRKIDSAVPPPQENKNQLLYQQAIGLLGAQKFDEALSIFKKLEDYNDSKEKAQICIAAKENAKKESLYSYAVSLLNASKVSEADIKNTIVALKSIENYRNTKEVITKLEQLLEKCLESQRAAQEAALKRQYFAATSHFKAGAFDEAIKIFTSLGDYSDSKDQIKKCFEAKETARKQALYDGSVCIFNASNPTEEALKAAINNLKSIPDFKDSNEMVTRVEARLEKWYADRDAAIEARRIHLANVRARRKKIVILSITAIIIVAIIVAGIVFATHTFEIKYELDGGIFRVENNTSYTFITEDFTILNPIKEGYTFVGWTGTGVETPTKNLTIPQWSAGNKEFIANWQANDYVVEFVPNGGTMDTTSMVVTFDTNVQLPKPTRTGYTFVNWLSDDSRCFTDGIWKEASGVTLTASWMANNYKVTFEDVYKVNAENIIYSSGSSITQTATYDKNLTLFIPTRTGYGFLGWYNGETLIESGIWSIDSDVTLKAQWLANSNTIILNANGGTVSSAYITATYDQAFTLPTPTRTGYTFEGWFNGDTQYFSGTWNELNDVTLVAKWTANSNTIILNANGGTVSSAYIIATYDQAFTLPTPTRTGYTFDGWFNGDKQYFSGTWNELNNVTLVAKWIANSNTIILDVNGGTVSSTSINVTYDQAFTLPTPTRTGYTFDGWFSVTKQYFDGIWNELDDVTLTALWTVNTYNITYSDISGTTADITVTFDYNYAGSTPTTVTLTNGETLEYPEIPTLSGYAFTGWYTDAGSSTKYDFTGEITEDITLYAGWTSVSYTALSPNSSNNIYLYSTSTYYSFVSLKTGYVTISIGKNGYLRCTTTGDKRI